MRSRILLGTDANGRVGMDQDGVVGPFYSEPTDFNGSMLLAFCKQFHLGL